MSEWKNCTLGDLGEVVGGGTPSTKKPEYYGGDIAWITPKDLSTFSGRFIKHGERNITEEGLKGSSARLMPKNTILFSSRAPIGYVAIAENEVSTNQGFKSIVPNDDTDYLFLYYLLKFNKDKIENMGSGTTFKEVSGKTVKAIDVTVPSNKEKQHEIAKILGSLDDKIENNRKINHHLAEIAKSIFDSYFIDLSPYNGVMPDDWQLSNLTGIANYLNGLAMQKHRPQSNEQGLTVLKIKELRQGFTDSTSDLCSSNIRRDYIIHDGDVIFSWSGSLLVDFWTGGDCGLNQHLFKVSSETYDKWFYYAWTKHHLDRFVKMAADRATTMGHIKRDALEKAEVLIPSNKDYQEIGNKLKPIYDQIINNRVESRKLVALRDTLLPKLMSGEISVTD